MLFCFVLFCIVLLKHGRAYARVREHLFLSGKTIPQFFCVAATRGNRQSFDTNARRDTISCISDKKRNLHVQIGHFIFENIIYTCRLENLFLGTQSTYAD